MVILVTPTLQGLLPQWREAAENLGASAWEVDAVTRPGLTDAGERTAVRLATDRVRAAS